MRGKRIACLVAAVLALSAGSRAFAQADQRTSKCSDCKCNLVRSYDGWDCCCPKCSEHKLKHPPGTSCWMCEREAAEAAAKEKAKREKEQAEHDAAQKAFWNKVKRDQDAEQKKQKENHEKQQQVSQTWWNNFNQQQDDFWKKFNDGTKPALPPSPQVGGGGRGPKKPAPGSSPWRDPTLDDDAPYWYQKGLDEQRGRFGSRGVQNAEDDQPGWHGFSGAGHDSDDVSAPIGGGSGVGSGVPYLPAQLGESRAEAKIRRDREVERRKEEAARKQEEEAKAKHEADKKQAKANGEAMRELLGDAGDASSDPLDDLLGGVARPDAGAAPGTQAQRNADEIRDLLGSGTSSDSGVSTSDMLDNLLEQVNPSKFNHSSPYGTTAGAVGPAEHVYKNTLDAKPPEGLRAESTYSLSDGMKAAVYSGTFQGTEIVYVAWAGTEDGKDWATNAGAYTKVFAQSGDDNSYTPSQFKHAVELAKQVQATHPGKEIILTGHSLGGMVAAYASDRTGLPAVIFNSAGTKRMIQEGKKARGDSTPSRVAHVNATGDILTQDAYVAYFSGRPWSTDIKTVQSPTPGINVSNHSIEPLADSVRTGAQMTPSGGRTTVAPWHLQYLDSRGAPR